MRQVGFLTDKQNRRLLKLESEAVGAALVALEAALSPASLAFRRSCFCLLPPISVNLFADVIMYHAGNGNQVEFG